MEKYCIALVVLTQCMLVHILTRPCVCFYYLPIHIIFERLEAVTVLNIWRVLRNDKSDTTSLGPVAL